MWTTALEQISYYFGIQSDCLHVFDLCSKTVYESDHHTLSLCRLCPTSDRGFGLLCVDRKEGFICHKEQRCMKLVRRKDAHIGF